MSAPWQHDKRVLSEGVCTQMHSKHGVGSEFGAGGGVWSGTSLLSLAHIFLCVCYNTAFVYGGQIEVHVGCPLVFYVIRLPSPTSLLSLERKQEKAIKQCWFKTPPVQGSSPFLFFGISTEVLLFCGSPAFWLSSGVHLRARGWRGVIGELRIPAHSDLASVSTMKLQVPSLSCTSQPCSSSSIPPVLCWASSLEVVTSQPDSITGPFLVLHFRNDRTTWCASE